MPALFDISPARSDDALPERGNDILPLPEVVWTDFGRLSGAPCFTRTRVPVKALFDYLEGGEALDAFLDDFPGVTRTQAISALYYGKARLLPEGVPQPTGESRIVHNPIRP